MGSVSIFSNGDGGLFSVEGWMKMKEMVARAVGREEVVEEEL
jgi:hypothetical protein